MANYKQVGGSSEKHLYLHSFTIREANIGGEKDNSNNICFNFFLPTSEKLTTAEIRDTIRELGYNGMNNVLLATGSYINWNNVRAQIKGVYADTGALYVMPTDAYGDPANILLSGSVINELVIKIL